MVFGGLFSLFDRQSDRPYFESEPSYAYESAGPGPVMVPSSSYPYQNGSYQTASYGRTGTYGQSYDYGDRSYDYSSRHGQDRYGQDRYGQDRYGASPTYETRFGSPSGRQSSLSVWDSPRRHSAYSGSGSGYSGYSGYMGSQYQPHYEARPVYWVSEPQKRHGRRIHLASEHPMALQQAYDEYRTGDKNLPGYMTFAHYLLRVHDYLKGSGINHFIITDGFVYGFFKLVMQGNRLTCKGELVSVHNRRRMDELLDLILMRIRRQTR